MGHMEHLLVAPIQSLATAAMERGGFKQPATVFFCAKTKNDLIDQGHFLYLKTKYRNFDYKYTLAGKGEEHSLQGRIPFVLADLFPDLSNYDLYTAGRPAFVDDCLAKVKELGAQEEHIHLERYVQAHLLHT